MKPSLLFCAGMLLAIGLLVSPAHAADDEITVTSKEVKAFLTKDFPLVAKDLPKIEKDDPEHYEEIIAHFEFILIEYLYLQRDEPKMAKTFLEMEQLEMKTHLLAEAFHDAEDETRDQADAAFKAHLEKLIDLRLIWERRELKELKQQVQALEDMIEDMEANRTGEMDHMRSEWLGLDDDEDEGEGETEK